MFTSTAIVTLQMFLQVIFSIESFTTFRTNLIFATRVSNHMTRQMLVAFERFTTHVTSIRSIFIMTLLMAIQVFLSFQARSANITADVREAPPDHQIYMHTRSNGKPTYLTQAKIHTII